MVIIIMAMFSLGGIGRMVTNSITSNSPRAKGE